MDAFLQRVGSLHKSIHGSGMEELGRMLHNCEDMLRDRGCHTVSRADDPMATIEQGTEPLVWGEGGGGDGAPVFAFHIYFHMDEKVGVKWLRSLLGDDDAMEEGHGQGAQDEEQSKKRRGVHVVVISTDGPTPFTRKECEGKQVQFLLARHVCVNVTKHHLVPTHIRVDRPPDGMTPNDLPKMFETDPIAQYYAWPPGTVVRIERRFGGHEPVPYFRVVSPASN